MLQMKCPKCEEIISSPFLVEVGSISCNHCEENVTVKDVFVKTKGFTIHRDTLLDRVRHYRTLLEEVKREMMLPRDSDASSTAAQQSLDQYYAALRELMEAARGNYRLTISQDLTLAIELAGSTSKGRLLNLSTKGAAIKPTKQHGSLRQGSEIKLRFALPGIAEPLSLVAKIAWIGKNEKDEKQSSTTMGVSFINLSNKVRTYIWDYIVDNQKNSLCLGKSNPILAIS
jgi:Tfp pilus assembly protein PilZ